MFSLHQSTWLTQEETLLYTLAIRRIARSATRAFALFVDVFSGNGPSRLALVSPNCNFPHECLMPKCNGYYLPNPSARLIMLIL